VTLAGDSPPLRPILKGTRLVHYGPTWDESLEKTRETSDGPVAVLVCHGMGQQVKYETISAVAEAILREAQALGGAVTPVEVHLSEENGQFLARAEIKWIDKDGRKHEAHVYEAYWAPVTEGRVTYWDTVNFLLHAAGNGLRYSRPFMASSFDRWIFGGHKTMRIGGLTFLALICVLLFLALQVGIIGYVALELAQQYRSILSQPLPTVAANGFLHAWFKWLAPLFPGHEVLLHFDHLDRAWWSALGYLVLWFVSIAEAFAARYFIVEYAGDVAAYISPYKASKFDEIRHRIQQIGLDVGKAIYGFGAGIPTVPNYRKVVLVGHSLGSVLAYDTLNALINQDNVSAPENRRQVGARTRALITLGSPLDKTAFVFRMQPRNEQDWIREQLAASVQPLIVSYELYRPASFEWVNIWSKMDIVSGALDYYDDPAVSPKDPRHVQNMIDPEARRPLLAHLQYWTDELLRRQLYRLVS
jgi:hypothetical protein